MAALLDARESARRDKAYPGAHLIEYHTLALGRMEELIEFAERARKAVLAHSKNL
jgi:hypothetical protein